MAKKAARTIADLDERTRSWARAGAVGQLETHAQEVRDAFPEMSIRLVISAKPAEPQAPTPPAPPAASIQPNTPAETVQKRRIMPPESRKKIARKMRARWRARKATGKNRL